MVRKFHDSRTFQETGWNFYQSRPLNLNLNGQSKKIISIYFKMIFWSFEFQNVTNVCIANIFSITELAKDNDDNFDLSPEVMLKEIDLFSILSHSDIVWFT